MRYYIYKRGGKIVGYNSSTGPLPPPAIEITEDEARELGIYTPAPAPTSAPEPEDPVARLKAQVAMLEAQQTFLEDCILEMADEVYA